MYSAVYFGSVNRWECDENDHLNVRFFAQKMQQTLQYGLIELGIHDSASTPEACRQIINQHMRFIGEARMAVPMTGYIGIIDSNATSLSVSLELRNSSTEQVLANFLVELAGSYSHVDVPTVPVPDHAGARGLTADSFCFQHLSAAELLNLGCAVIGRGVIQAEECDGEGYLQAYQYVGRNSDSMPNLFAKFESDQRGNGITGGAVLEYRMNFYEPLRLGDRFQLISGVKSLAEKTQIFVHALYNSDTGSLVTGSEALGIAMDLEARKAIPIPPEKRKRMTELLIQT